MSKFAVELRDAVVSYRSHLALRGVSLDVRRGEFVGVIGPNGGGKTTLLMLINGLRRAQSGTVRVLDAVPMRGSAHRLRSRIGYVAQFEAVDARLPITVKETVLTGCYGRLGWFRRPGKVERASVSAALERVGIAHLADRPIGHLSGGEYQRTAIARVLVQQPELFLFDEPTASLDPQAQQEVMGIIQALHAQEKATILYVTHDLSTLPPVCRRILLMKKGEIWREEASTSALESRLLGELYDGETAMPLNAPVFSASLAN